MRRHRLESFAIPTNGLVFYAPLWKLDGTIFSSQDVYGHLCTVTGATWGPKGRTFDGNDLITLPDNATFNLLAGFSVVGWLRPDLESLDTASRRVFTRTIDSNNGFTVAVYGTALQVGTKIATVFAAKKSPTITLGRTYHFAGTWDGATLLAYLNGKVSATAGDAQSIAAASGTFIGSRDATAGRWNGKIGEIMIYNRALSISEIMNHYLLTAPIYL